MPPSGQPTRRAGTTKRQADVPPSARNASPGPPEGCSRQGAFAWHNARVAPLDRPPLLVSACLLGVACNHEGRHSRRDAVVALAVSHRLVPICPEMCGGLTTPRDAAELVGDRVRTHRGDDVSDAYERGARAAVELALAIGARRAVLKARSPSCGPSQVYDGTFTRTLRAGEGVTAAALRAADVEVVSEDDLDA